MAELHVRENRDEAMRLQGEGKYLRFIMRVRRRLPLFGPPSNWEAVRAI